MSRRTEVQDLLFDVELRPLFTRFGNREAAVRDSQAVVDVKGERVVSVVGRGYRLVSHREALDLAFDCAEAAFPETRSDHWQVMLADGPSTGGACFIDLSHNSSALDFADVSAGARPDTYGPFVRVINSYNRTRALSFEIGYYRKVCKNGLIMRDSLMRFKMSHQRRDIGETVHFEIDQRKLGRQRADFLAFLAKLQGCAIPAPMVAGFSCKVLGFQPPATPQDASDSNWIAWQELSKIVGKASDRYIAELGAKANAVLNVVTEIASSPPENSAVRRDRNSLQRRAGQWVSEFATVCDAEGFDVAGYLESLKLPVPGGDRLGWGAVAASD